jgi:hypothetical protein
MTEEPLNTDPSAMLVDIILAGPEAKVVRAKFVRIRRIAGPIIGPYAITVGRIVGQVEIAIPGFMRGDDGDE